MKSGKVRVNPLAYAVLVETLMEGAHTYHELSYECGFSYQTTREIVNHLWKRGLVYVAEWGIDSRNHRSLRMFTFNIMRKEVDVNQPRTETGERSRRYRLRQKERASHLQKMLALAIMGHLPATRRMAS